MKTDNREENQEDQPLFTISVAAQTLNVSAQKLRIIEGEGLVSPRRTAGKTRLYSRNDIEKMRVILSLMDDLGINLAGVEVILHMRDQMRKMQKDLFVLMKEFLDHIDREGGLDSKALMPAAKGMLLRIGKYFETGPDEDLGTKK